MAYELKTFTLRLENTCLAQTYANIYFRLNNGRTIGVSNNIPAETEQDFVYTFNVDTTVENILYVTGDHIGSYELT
jgi:hypothetical protein